MKALGIRWALASGLLLALSTTTGCGSPAPVSVPTPAASTAATSSASPTTPTPSAEKTPIVDTCAERAAALTLDQQIGQLLMVAVNSGGMTAAEAEILDNAQVGSVILLGNSTSGLDAISQVTKEVRAAIKPPKGIRTLLAADQEGGRVQRLQGEGFDRIPSAPAQAEFSDKQLTAKAKRWGSQLREAGINADLAPVADLVPKSMINVNEPVGLLERGYSSDPQVIAKKASAFIQGMDQAGVATSLKHFPGLGRVHGNTDFAAGVVDSDTTRDDPGLASFKAGIDAGADMVMVASAIYDKIDPDQPGPFSKTIISGMIRKDLGFDGVVISDDLAARAVSDYPAADRATRFVAAGGDLIIMGDATLVPTLVKGLKKKAKADPEFADQVTASAARVIKMKVARGLADCG